MTNLIMFDALDLSQIPSGAPAVAGYVNGRWPTFPHLRGQFPGARLLSIAVTAGADAECLDIETGDAAPADAARWYVRQRARGVTRPCLYASVSLMESAVVPAMRAAGIDRSAVRLWSAHYSGLPHICGPSSCRGMSVEADATQWTNRALGRDLDESLLLADFFDAAKPPPSPAPDLVPAWQEAMMQALPVVKQGDQGEHVRTVQGLCIARGHQVTVDGAFGPATHGAVVAVQAAAREAQDGVVGPLTWAALAGV